MAACAAGIAGISGIVGGLLRNGTTDRAWRIAFVVGLVAGPLLLRATGYTLPDSTPVEAQWRTVSTPLTKTCSTPLAGRVGAS